MIALEADLGALRTLVEVVLDPPTEPEHKGMVAQGSIETLLKRHNGVQVGVADPVVVTALPHEERLDNEIKSQLAEFSFSCVRIALSFLPDRGCRFAWCRLSATLTSSLGTQAPVAFDIFPREVREKLTLKRSFGVTPKLAFVFGGVEGQGGSESEVIRYEPRLTVAGLLTDQIAWTFDALEDVGLSGTHELFLIIRHPMGAPVDCPPAPNCLGRGLPQTKDLGGVEP